ncbi:NUDIX domain-containing protein [Spongisporangium articulatum]|uniref:NUDIX domain-containing protein n=1 Tax=Spongisporangium articulatum TaxID=3362603 RepID=A0ABW8AMG1_9ACTN
MSAGDGNAWVHCHLGHRHWGRYGAAGLVLVRGARDEPAPRQILLQLRAAWTHEGGTWGVPGGARDSHESIETAAVREAEEEAGLDGAALKLPENPLLVGTDHGEWSYTYVLAFAPDDLTIGPPTQESEALAWVDLDAVPGLALHSGFAATWPAVQSWITTP